MAASSTHPRSIPAQTLAPALDMETVFPDERTAWLVFHGEADLATRDTLHAHLATASQLGTGTAVHLHLADLTFADSRAVRDISDFVAGARERGTTVVTCEPTPILRRVATLLGVALVLGLA